jgi:hypothetical protein
MANWREGMYMREKELQGRIKRRGWLGLLTGCAASFAAVAWGMQTAVQNPPHPKGSEPASGDDENPKLQPPAKAILEANDKDIKKSVERLYQLAGELKAEVEKTDSVQVLSLAMLKKTEEIEKLAREIRSRAKG